jgi:hypothetical protein
LFELGRVSKENTLRVLTQNEREYNKNRTGIAQNSPPYEAGVAEGWSGSLN